MKPEKPTDPATWGEIPLPELLDLVTTLGRELLGPGPGDPSGAADPERGALLRVALAELSDRAARLYPGPPAACSCGERFATPEDLEEHFRDVFVPADDIAPDGTTHAEISGV